MAELYQNYDGLQEFCKPPNKPQTRSTFITSSPRWLITLMVILPFLGLSKGRLVSLLRVALGRASHRDTKTRRQETGRRGFVLWERRGPPRPLCSAPLATRHISSTHSIHAVSWRSPSRSPACGESLSRRHTRHGEKFSPGPPTSSSASAILSDDSTATPRNPVRQNAGPIRAFA